MKTIKFTLIGLLFAILLSQSLLIAVPIDLNIAENVANFQLVVKEKTDDYSISDITIFQNENEEEDTLAYIANLEPYGFIIVTPDTDITPILAYSFNCNFPMDDDENNILYHLVKNDMQLRLQARSDTTFPKIQENNQLWEYYINEDPEYLERPRDQWPPEGSTSTGGWVETAWDQLSPYNDFCPLDPVTEDRCVVGCVATAMAQIINYHKYIGNASFNCHDDHYVTSTRDIDIDGDYGILDFPSFGSLNSYLTTLRNDYLQDDPFNFPITHDDIAALNFAVGISTEMDYTSGCSGASPTDVVPALLDKFDYTSAEYMNADDSFFYDILSQNMIDALPAELGLSFWFGQGYHAVVCDGYNTDDFYHLNFGWGENSPDPITEAWYTLPNGYPGAGSAIGAIVNIETISGTIVGNVTLQISGSGWHGDVLNVEVTAGSVTVHPDYDGNYTIQLPPGFYDVTASLYGYYPVTIENVEVEEGSITDNIDFFLELYEGNTIYVDCNNTVGPWLGTQEHPYQFIQDGIDNAIDSDTVLVFIGTYQENINYMGKLITIASEYLTTGDEVYISQTIIDGNQNGSVVKFENEEDYRAILCGFTITNGSAEKGGGIKCSYASPTLDNLIITGNMSDYGGGVYIYDYSNPSLSNITINANYGAGIYCDYYSNPCLSNVTIKGNNAINGAGIYCKNNSTIDFDSTDRCNIFLNFADIGNDLYAGYNCPIIDVIVDTFTVFEPDDYFAHHIDNFTFDILHAKVEQVNADLYVSPTGSNDNSGLTIDEPLQTISYALVKIIANHSNRHTIHLANGTNSPSQTGEIFPLYCRSYVSLQGTDVDYTILDGEELSGILYCNGDNDFSIEDITFQNGNSAFGAGIYLSSSSLNLNNLIISGNNALNNGGAVYCGGESSPSLTNIFISGNNANNGAGIYCSSSSPSLINIIISENTVNNKGAGIYCSGSNPILNNVTIINNIANSGGGVYIDWSLESNPILKNCILWNDIPHEIYDPNSEVTATYSDIQDGTGQPWFGEGCIDEDPLLVEEGNHLYHLLEGSPCIDAGDPNPHCNDPDGTRNDMGCYPTVYDVKKIKNIWNWVSFPRLERDGNEPVAAPDVLENIEPFPTYLKLEGGWDVYLEYIYGVGWDLTHGLEYIQSTSGYKLWTDNTENSYLPLDGSRLASNTSITLLGKPYWNWIGYWLPQTQMSDVAFGDEWNNVRYVKGEDYFYFDGSMEEKGGTGTNPISYDPIPMRYGKGYMVQVHNTIENFQWNSSGEKISPPEKSEPQNFTYTDKPDYEVIDIVDIDESIIEIGVFEDDICVGAAVVDSGRAQIFAYTDSANKDVGELTFQFVTGRGNKQKVNSYSVYDFITGEYVERKLTAGRQEYSIVRLNTGGGVTFPTEVSLSQNCPNPFGSNTTISYALPEEPVVEISIYNIRGQRVKTLVSGKLSAGNHSIIWNGKDDNSKRLGNGIYFYKLSAGKKRIIKKMLLMR